MTIQASNFKINIEGLKVYGVTNVFLDLNNISLENRSSTFGELDINISKVEVNKNTKKWNGFFLFLLVIIGILQPIVPIVVCLGFFELFLSQNAGEYTFAVSIVLGLIIGFWLSFPFFGSIVASIFRACFSKNCTCNFLECSKLLSIPKVKDDQDQLKFLLWVHAIYQSVVGLVLSWCFLFIFCLFLIDSKFIPNVTEIPLKLFLLPSAFYLFKCVAGKDSQSKLSLLTTMGVIPLQFVQQAENLALESNESDLASELGLSVPFCIVYSNLFVKKPFFDKKLFIFDKKLFSFKRFYIWFLHYTVGTGLRLSQAFIAFVLFALIGASIYNQPGATMRSDEHKTLSDTEFYLALQAVNGIKLETSVSSENGTVKSGSKKNSASINKVTPQEQMASRVSKLARVLKDIEASAGGSASIEPIHLEEIAKDIRKNYLSSSQSKVPRSLPDKTRDSFQYNNPFRFRDALGISLQQMIPLAQIVMGNDWEPSRRPIIMSPKVEAELSKYKSTAWTINALKTKDLDNALTYQDFATIQALFGWIMVPLLIGSLTSRLKRINAKPVSTEG